MLLARKGVWVELMRCTRFYERSEGVRSRLEKGMWKWHFGDGGALKCRGWGYEGAI